MNPYAVPDYLEQDFNSRTTHSDVQKISLVTRAVQSIPAIMSDMGRRSISISGKIFPA